MSFTIQKRSGEKVGFNPNKILTRIKKAAKGLDKVDANSIFADVITSFPDEEVITTSTIDKLISEIASSYTGTHHNYSLLAGNVAMSSHHKETNESFSDTMKILHEQGVVSKGLIDIIDSYGAKKIDVLIAHERDFNFDYFGWKSLQQMYLLKNGSGVIVERPQHMYMRVALWVTNSFKEAKEYYESLSRQLISPATPIMINAGTVNPQLASCVLHHNNGDSGDALLDTFVDVSKYSSSGAGIGICMSNIRSKESRISSSGGYAMGLLKYLKIVNEGLRGFNQQGRRPGAAAIYIEPWHKDIIDFLEIKRNTGDENLRARDIFTALWMSDSFINAVKEDLDWYLFCPNDIKKAGLKPFQKIYGEEFEKEYQKAVELGIGKKIQAREIWKKIYESVIETGVPYLLNKDNANRKTNHQNIGTLSQSNLCAEIFQFVDEQTTAICTLSSMVLKNFIIDGKFDFQLLHQEVRRVTRALNKVIDINKYVTKKGEKGGLEQRAIAIGVQGMADVFFLLDYVFDSEQSIILNKQIFETIYHAAITESASLCEEGKYKPYSQFEGSPMSKGIFQFDMWGVSEESLSGLWDWQSLKKKVVKYGVCNSLTTAQMPVASSSKITGSFEMTEPAHSAIFSRRVVGGEIVIVNKYLINDFEKLGIWGENLKNEIIMNDGSIANINFNKYFDPESKNYEKQIERASHLIKKYRTTWEIPQKSIINMAVDRGLFIDQSQSMNLYLSNPSLQKFTSAIMYGSDNGLKTLSYYIRTKAISTGAKHLATDISRFASEKSEQKTQPSTIIEKPIILPQKPEDSQFDCVGCSS
jgi:ribonucleoside-diphosphate reductase alpha chain